MVNKAKTEKCSKKDAKVFSFKTVITYSFQDERLALKTFIVAKRSDVSFLKTYLPKDQMLCVNGL